MRITYINKTAFDSTLPSVNFSLHYAYGLAMAGAECTLYGQRTNADFTSEKLLDQFELEPLETLTIHLFTRRRWLGIQSNQWFYLKTFRRLKIRHRERRIDAVISRDPGALPYLARMQKKGLPVFYQPHNFYADLSVRPDVNPKNAVKYHHLECRYIPKLSGLLCLQSAQAEWYHRVFPDQKIITAPPGLIDSHESSQNGNSSEEQIIGYVGSLQMQKGIEGLMQSFQTLLKTMPELRLLLLGGRNETEIQAARETARQRGIENAVEISGWIPYRSVKRQLKRMTVAVIPLQDNFYNRYLTAPNKLFDYMASAVPIVTSDLPSIRSLITEREAIFIPPDDSEALTRSLKDVLGDPQRLFEKRRAMFEIARDYYWPIHGQFILRQLDATSNPNHTCAQTSS